MGHPQCCRVEYTVHDVYITLKDRMLEGSQDWEFPQCLIEQPHGRFVGHGQTSEFQSVVVTTKIGELVQLFSQYAKYLMQSPAEGEAGPSSSLCSAIEVTMAARKVVRLPAAKEGGP